MRAAEMTLTLPQPRAAHPLQRIGSSRSASARATVPAASAPTQRPPRAATSLRPEPPR